MFFCLFKLSTQEINLHRVNVLIRYFTIFPCVLLRPSFLQQSMGVRALPTSNLTMALVSLFCFFSPVGLYAVMLSVKSKGKGLAGSTADARRLGEVISFLIFYFCNYI